MSLCSVCVHVWRWEGKGSGGAASYKLEDHLLSGRSSSEGKHRLKTGVVVLVEEEEMVIRELNGFYSGTDAILEM